MVSEGSGASADRPFAGIEQRGEEHRQRAADQIVVRHALGVRQHAEPDPQPFDRGETGSSAEQPRHIGKGPHPCGRQPLAHGGFVAAAFAVAFPQQGGNALVAAGRHQFLQGMAANDQSALLAVDFAHDGVGDDHAVEAAVHPCLQHRISP